MADIAKRFDTNPILRPTDAPPSRDGLQVECLLNPGVFQFEGKTWLLLRVAERPKQTDGWITTPVLSKSHPSGIDILEFEHTDPELVFTDPRLFQHKGVTYLTTLSHLRLAESKDGLKFTIHPEPTLIGDGELETFGIEDCRVAEIEGVYYLTYTAVSVFGVGVGMISTRDWRKFERHGIIIPPHNKDCALFEGKVGPYYYALHRPSGAGLGGNYIWISRSPDLDHWGRHMCIARTRPGYWDSVRVGAGASPIRTDQGWLVIYHGANEEHRYCLGAILLDLEDPTKVVARSVDPIMEPIAEYEKTGFFGNVVFTNGHVVNGDIVTIYYGASDEVICGAEFSIHEILSTLGISA